MNESKKIRKKKQSVINMLKDSEDESLVTIYTSETFTDIEDEIPKTPDSEKEDLDDILNYTGHLIICKMKIIDAPQSTDHSANMTSYAAYSIENAIGERALIAKQVEVGYYDHGRLPISFDVYNRHGHLIFTTDGRETKCGMYVLIKGHGEVVRGKVMSDGMFGYFIQDFLTGENYSLKLPPWVVIFTCMLLCFHPTLQILKKQDADKKTSKSTEKIPKLIATIGTRKWSGTVYSTIWRFGLTFDKSTDPDTKLFLFSAALVFFHLYFKRSGRELRCLFSYVIFLLLLSLIILIGVYVVKSIVKEEHNNTSPNTITHTPLNKEDYFL